jgi:hypothetical protein
MKKNFVALGLCWILIFSTTVMAQQTQATSTNWPNTDWNDVRQLLVGEKIAVERKDGKKLRGKTVSVSDAELVLERKKRPETLKRDEVRKVWRIAPPSRVKQTIFGGLGLVGGILAGTFIAVNLGFKQCGGSCADEGTGMIAALIGLPVAGALGGRALAGGGKLTLFYSVP